MPRSRSQSESEDFSRQAHKPGDSTGAGSPAWLADITHLAADALGLVMGMRDEAQAGLKAKAGRAARHLDLVTRGEFEACRLMLAKSREEQENLKVRLAILEEALAIRSGNKDSGKKPASGKARKIRRPV